MSEEDLRWPLGWKIAFWCFVVWLWLYTSPNAVRTYYGLLGRGVSIRTWPLPPSQAGVQGIFSFLRQLWPSVFVMLFWPALYGGYRIIRFAIRRFR